MPCYPHGSALRAYCVPITTSCDTELIDVEESRSSLKPEPTVPSPEPTENCKRQVCWRKVTGSGRKPSDTPGDSGLRKGTEPGRVLSSLGTASWKGSVFQAERNSEGTVGDTAAHPASVSPCIRGSSCATAVRLTWAQYLSPSLWVTSVE